MDIRKLRACVRREKYEISLHAEKERLAEEVSLRDLEDAILRGEIIEEYPDDPRGPSCLICGVSGQKAIHVVCGILPRGWIRIITVYIPRMPKWINSTQRKEG